jgi:hypothetical protein
MLPLILLLAGCGTVAGQTKDEAAAFQAKIHTAQCAGRKTIVISDQSKLTARDWDEVLAANCYSVKLGCSRPPKDPTICNARQ